MKRIKNMFKTFFSVTHANGGKSGIFFSVLNYSIPVFMGIYLFANPLPAAVVNEFCFYLSVSALILLLVFRKTTFTLRSPLTLPFILSLIHISEPTRLGMISYAVFCLKK